MSSPYDFFQTVFHIILRFMWLYATTLRIVTNLFGYSTKRNCFKFLHTVPAWQYFKMKSLSG
jgi:hypothetical protein